jgi:hypothetical protein
MVTLLHGVLFVNHCITSADGHQLPHGSTAMSVYTAGVEGRRPFMLQVIQVFFGAAACEHNHYV